ncbi:FecR family protein [Caulobacter sp. RL271]|jgi:transmembrane sensor|uniref:FecR domain-containing protein n=1 Tax=Caulobacter segnis TaxID=88688 RepID=A0ABY4ZNP0_9CAUL|nr:FecR domain-containing protein [Caulobacter segnis]USQ94165.1 FecR domain-containing protein [Caulobacter segnis]
MTSTTSGKERHDDPASTAATWFARLQDDDVSPQDRRDFQHWLNADARHAAAWDAVRATWDDLSGLENDPALAALRADALGAGEAPPRRLNRRALGLAAAGLVATVGGALLGRRWLEGDKTPAPAADEPVFTTAVGERSTFRLADNSVVTLGTDSAVRVNHWGAERRLTLLRGQAYFQVAKDKTRPFIVSAGDKSVTAVGTAFDVRMEPGKLSVTLVEGRVRIVGASPQGQRRIEMSAGSRFVANGSADWAVATVDTAKESAWLQGRLVFDAEPLSSVVAEMNRYSTRKLALADPTLAATPVSGVFKTGQIDAFVAALRTYGLAEVGRSDDKQVELVSPGRGSL